MDSAERRRILFGAFVMSSGLRAGIDCGSNSTRLLVIDDGEVVAREMRITKLGAGVDADKLLTRQGRDRVLAVLGEFSSQLRRLGVSPSKVRIGATSAVRDSTNRDDFVEEILSVIPCQVDVLSGEEEARLTYLGASDPTFSNSGRLLFADIGGGSTELILGEGLPGTQPQVATSLDVGCVRLTERFLHSDPPEALELSQAITYTTSALEEACGHFPDLRLAQGLVGLAGTVSSVAMVFQGLPEYDRLRVHGFCLRRTEVEEVFRTLATESALDRSFNPGLESGRVQTIVGGMCVLVSIMRFFSFDMCRVSESDILDGLAMTAGQSG